MITNEQQYQETKRLYHDWKKRTQELRARLKKAGYTPRQIKRALNPQISFYLGFAKEAAEYERRTKQTRSAKKR